MTSDVLAQCRGGRNRTSGTLRECLAVSIPEHTVGPGFTLPVQGPDFASVLERQLRWS